MKEHFSEGGEEQIMFMSMFMNHKKIHNIQLFVEVLSILQSVKMCGPRAVKIIFFSFSPFLEAEEG